MSSGHFWLDSGRFWLGSGRFWLGSGGLWSFLAGFRWFRVISGGLGWFRVVSGYINNATTMDKDKEISQLKSILFDLQAENVSLNMLGLETVSGIFSFQACHTTC